MINKNSIILGIIIGLLVPFVGVAILMLLDESIVSLDLSLPNGNSYMGQAERTLYLLAICLNLIPFQYFQRQRQMSSLRGIIFPTMLYAFAWLSYFSPQIFNS